MKLLATAYNAALGVATGGARYHSGGVLVAVPRRRSSFDGETELFNHGVGQNLAGHLFDLGVGLLLG